MLPVATGGRLKSAVTGGHAQEGIICGTGSGAVLPVGGFAGVVKIGGPGIMAGGRNMFLIAPSPLAELTKLLPDAHFDFDPGYLPAEAALLAKRSDLLIAFGVRVECECFDNTDLSLRGGKTR